MLLQNAIKKINFYLMNSKIEFLRCFYYDNIIKEILLLSFMLSALKEKNILKKYKNISAKFIDIVNNVNFIFNDEIKKNTKAFIYKSKITTKDLLLYRFRYIEKGLTFARISAKINNNKLLLNKEAKIFNFKAISTKDNQIPSFIYKNIYNYLFNELDKVFNFNNKIIVIDGTYSNTNIKHNGDVETSMSLIFYDPYNNLNLDINFTGGEKKNNEKIKLQEYIIANIDKFKNKTIIMDRAYHCYDFFKFLNDNNINFIIRMKDKDPVNKNKIFESIKKDINIYKNICNNIKTVYDKDKKQIKKEKQEIVKLATNIKNLKECKIFELYGKRWSVEESIKQLKENFKFQVLKEYKEDNYQKIFYCELIEMLLKCCLVKLYNIKNDKTESKTDNKKKNNKIIKLNENLILGGIKDTLIENIIDGNFNFENLENLFETHFIEHQNEANRSIPRVSKIPFTKWYIKKYHELYKEKIKLCNNELKIIKVLNKDDPKIVKIKKEILALKKEKKEILLKLKEN